jgi:hypothetical protein
MSFACGQIMMHAMKDDGSREWGIYGHHDDSQARHIVEAYEEETLGSLGFYREHQRAVTVRNCQDCDEDGPHVHYVNSKPGRGAFAITWVWEKQ